MKISPSNLKNYKLLFVSVLSFILGSMLTINLFPIDRTCRIEKTDREYNIMNNSKLKNPDIIILILSAPRNLERRTVIRETWLKLLDKKNNEGDIDVKFKMKHFFVIGSEGLDVDDVLHLTSEQSQFNDMLILPLKDSYNNLTMKISKSFGWLSEQVDVGLEFKYVLKCDDDSFVRVDSLAHEIEHIEILYLKSILDTYEEKNSPYIRINAQVNTHIKKERHNLQIYWGYFHGNARVKNSGKWKEDNWILCDNYLPYALGGGYILSKELVRYLGRNSPYFRYYHSEDVSVGAWLSSVSDVLRIHDSRFDTEWISRGCQNHHLILHNISEEQMRQMYDSIIKTGHLCPNESIKRSHYLYDWLLLPSKCCNRKK